jgi:polyferredoxin
MNDLREQVRLSTRPANPGTRLSALRKKLTRRACPDHSQVLRRTIQLAFLFLNVWLGVAFYFWVRRMETGAPGRIVVRPAGVEGWLPIAGLMNLKYWLTTGRVPASHPAALFLLVSFLAIAFLFRKAFCSWLCPVGTFSEYLWRAGRQIFGRSFQVPRWLDLPMRSLKYLLLGFFAWAIANMTPDAIERFMHSPYGAVADVRMLNFFRDLGQTAAIVLGALVIASALVQNFWCRYLCPYGALLGLTSLLSPLRIRRSEPACIDCAKCAKACPSALPVDKLVNISRPSVRDVWSALPCARPKAPCNSRWAHGRVLPITVDFRHGSWPLELQSYSSESSDMQRPPVIGTVTCPTTFIAN